MNSEPGSKKVWHRNRAPAIGGILGGVVGSILGVLLAWPTPRDGGGFAEISAYYQGPFGGFLLGVIIGTMTGAGIGRAVKESRP
jgi:hypothetical protein